MIVTTKENLSVYQRIKTHWWYGSFTAFIWGSIVVVFLSLLGGAIEQSTNIITVSGELTTTARMTSIGLGTGYYLGSSLKRRKSDETWFLFGVFSTLTILSANTIDVLISNQYPAYYLLICGAILTIVAHISPFVADNEEHVKLLKYLSGYASSVIVVILAIAGYILTFITSIWNWYLSQPLPGQAFPLGILNFSL